MTQQKPNMTAEHHDNPIINALLNRQSTPAKLLTQPAPNDEQLQLILRCALSAPDHGGMRPWRLSVLSGEQRQLLADALYSAQSEAKPNMPEPEQQKIRLKAFRAPMIIGVAASLRDNPKVPQWEQLAACAAAAEHIQLATRALGFSSIWLSGPYTQHAAVKAAFGFESSAHLLAMLYIGSNDAPPPTRRQPDLAPFLVKKPLIQ